MATEWLGLAEVATRARAERTVARTASGPIDHIALRARIAMWRDALAAREGVRWALHFEESTDFAAALYGAWHAGKEVVLCTDVLPETLARLAQGVHGLAGDFPPRCGALALRCGVCVGQRIVAAGRNQPPPTAQFGGHKLYRRSSAAGAIGAAAVGV